MNFIKTEIPEVFIIEPKVFGDHRGYFFESFRDDEFRQHIGDVTFVQDNQSKSSYGVLRGLHFQTAPFCQSKLVRCLQGSVLDVAVDLRIGSPTYGKHVAVELSAENHRQLFIPHGFAHGFVVLSEEAIFAYKCDNYYSPAHDGGVKFDDPAIGIDWRIPVSAMKLSDKDLKQPLMEEVKSFKYEDFRKEDIYK